MRNEGNKEKAGRVTYREGQNKKGNIKPEPSRPKPIVRPSGQRPNQNPVTSKKP